jgi:hypothetical protein
VSGSSRGTNGPGRPRASGWSKKMSDALERGSPEGAARLWIARRAPTHRQVRTWHSGAPCVATSVTRRSPPRR